MSKMTKSEVSKITIDNLNEEQKETIKNLQNEFYREFEKYPETNNYWHILRFLRARSFDYVETKKMLQNYFSFRDTKDMNKVGKIEMPPKFLKEYYVRGYYHNSKEGNPVNYDRIGYCNLH